MFMPWKSPPPPVSWTVVAKDDENIGLSGAVRFGDRTAAKGSGPSAGRVFFNKTGAIAVSSKGGKAQ